jgi:hypothetical protein
MGHSANQQEADDVMEWLRARFPEPRSPADEFNDI